MSEIVLITDTSSDLSDTIVKEFGITRIPFYVSFNQVDYFKEIVEMPIKDFYTKMRESKVFPKTSLPSINDYLEVFTPLAEAGKSIICVCLSGYFSGSYSSAVNAKEIILENYPNTQIAIINSLNATGGQGLLVTEIGRMIQDGLEFDQIIDLTDKLIEKARIFFFVDTLDYLENGGRIGKASALLGTMLNVKPILFLEKGQLYPLAKVRGKKKAIAKIIESTVEYIGDRPCDYNYIVGHADNLEDANTILAGARASIAAPIPDEFFFIGVTIGVNTGPDACGICVIPKYQTLM
ncbi:DegV family protein [Niameybacter massiliensis]|uniref:DegV family protein n=1 Tax=Holtiella tumoricola TaxID=3018743 RepID=A0AA42DR82_9FIRM|nr:DegV family protein [Holtiella tumoricola]MDA3733919.1 DegV family protein [Holtiella tumoricola]